MDELTKQAKLLRTQIEEAFADVPYPGDENLYDGWQLDDDYEDVINNLTGKHWRDLIPKRRGQHNPLTKDIIFCSAAAWQFFLPAYMIADMMSGESELYTFEPERSERLRDHVERRFSRLNAKQCAAVASYLRYAGALIDKKQEEMPQYSRSFERERQRLAPTIAYWDGRATLAAETGSESA